MPVIKRELNITELLNMAVEQQNKIHESRVDILRRPASIWHKQEKYNQKIQKSKNAKKANVGTFEFDAEKFSQKHNGFKPTESIFAAFKEYGENFYYFMMDDKFIPLSKFCETLNVSSSMKAFRMLLAVLAVLIIILEAPRDEQPPSVGVVVIDYFVNVCFMVDCFVHLFNIPMRLRIEDAFSRKTRYRDLIFVSGGIKELPLVIACLAVGLTQTGKWLRLIRLVLLTTSFIDVLPHLVILLSSLTAAMESIIITVILMFVCIMIYASFGHLLLQKNDPYHFGTYGLSLWSFFHFAVFDDWSQLWYINYGGCDSFPTELEMDFNRTLVETIKTRSGVFESAVCTHPEASPVVSSIIFLTFTFLCAYVLLNMTMAAVVIGVKGGLDMFKHLELYGKDDSDLKKEMEESTTQTKTGGTNNGRRSSVVQMNAKALKMTGGHKESAETKKLILKIWAGNDVSFANMHDMAKQYGDWTKFPRICAECHKAIATENFSIVYIAMCFLMAVFQIAEENEMSMWGYILVLQLVFTGFWIMQGFSMHHEKKVGTKSWGWFVFDTILLMIVYITLFDNSNATFEVYFQSCRMLYLVSALRHMVFIKDMELIMKSLSGSVYGILLLVVLVIIIFFYFAIAGVLLFKDAHPYMFRNVVASFSTMFQIVTYDNMDDIMRVCMFGCSNLGYDTGLPKYDNLCNKSNSENGLGWIAPIYFVCFSVMCSFIMMSSLIGLIISAMEKLMEIKNAEVEVWQDVNDVAEAYEVSKHSIELCLELFEKLDVNCNCHLTFVELQSLFTAIDITDEGDQFQYYMKVDRDGSGQLEFPEFCELLAIIGFSLEKTAFYRAKAETKKEQEKWKKFQTDLVVRQKEEVTGSVLVTQRSMQPQKQLSFMRKANKSASERKLNRGTSVAFDPDNSMAAILRGEADKLKKELSGNDVELATDSIIHDASVHSSASSSSREDELTTNAPVRPTISNVELKKHLSLVQEFESFEDDDDDDDEKMTTGAGTESGVTDTGMENGVTGTGMESGVTGTGMENGVTGTGMENVVTGTDEGVTVIHESAAEKDRDLAEAFKTMNTRRLGRNGSVTAAVINNVIVTPGQNAYDVHPSRRGSRALKHSFMRHGSGGGSQGQGVGDIMSAMLGVANSYAPIAPHVVIPSGGEGEGHNETVVPVISLRGNKADHSKVKSRSNSQGSAECNVVDFD